MQMQERSCTSRVQGPSRRNHPVVSGWVCKEGGDKDLFADRVVGMGKQSK